MEKCLILGNPQERLNSIDFKLGWLAAMVDGEGSVSIATQVGRKKSDPYFLVPYVTISGSDESSISRTKQYLSDLDIGHYCFVSSGPNRRVSNSGLVKTFNKSVSSVRVWGMKRAHKFLSLIAPYLSEKKERAMLAKEFAEKRLNVYDAMMKKRGSLGRLQGTPYTWEELVIYWKIRKLNGTTNKYLNSKSSESIRQATYKLFSELGKLKMYSELMGDHESQAEMS